MKRALIAFIFVTTSTLFIFQACSKSSDPEPPSKGPDQQSLSWSLFTKQIEPVFQPQYHVAGDASVIKFGGEYLMYYSCIDKATDALTICIAKSTDGLAWIKPNTGDVVDGRILKANPSWATALETSYALNVNGVIYLYFSGYIMHPDVPLNYPAYLGISYSGNGLDFIYPGNTPILAPTTDSLDHDAIYSPSVVKNNSKYYMIYAGYCFTSTKCKSSNPVAILGATSDDALLYTKNSTPVLEANPQISWMNKAVAEADLVLGPDGRYYLFFAGIDQNDVQSIGVAYSDQAFGPWTINPKPIISMGAATSFDEAGVTAPNVLIENNQVKLWYSGFAKDGFIRIGYATAPWPLVSQ